MIPITPAEITTNTVKPYAGFIPDRMGMRLCEIDVDPATNAYRVNLTLRAANAAEWGSKDSLNLSSGNMVGDILLWTNVERKTACLAAMQAMETAMMTLAKSWKEQIDEA